MSDAKEVAECFGSVSVDITVYMLRKILGNPNVLAKRLIQNQSCCVLTMSLQSMSPFEGDLKVVVSSLNQKPIINETKIGMKCC